MSWTFTSGQLLDELVLINRYRVLSEHRVGYAGSSRVEGPVSIAQQAGHCRSLMRHVGIERAHFVGHSSGGNIVMQMALDAPGAVADADTFFGKELPAVQQRSFGEGKASRITHPVLAVLGVGKFQQSSSGGANCCLPGCPILQVCCSGSSSPR